MNANEVNQVLDHIKEILGPVANKAMAIAMHRVQAEIIACFFFLGISLTVVIVLSLLINKIIRWFYRLSENDKDVNADKFFLMIIPSIILTGISFILTITITNQLIIDLTAPEWRAVEFLLGRN